MSQSAGSRDSLPLVFDAFGNPSLVLQAGAAANTAGAGVAGSGLLIWDGTKFQSAQTVNGASNTIGNGILGAGLMAWDNFNSVYRAVYVGQTVDAFPAYHGINVVPSLWNGSTTDKVQNSSASNLTAAAQAKSLISTPCAEWSEFHTPAATTKATCTHAAGGAGVYHVCKTISFTMIAVASQGALQINLRDGTTGAGTVKYSLTIALPAVNLHVEHTVMLNIVGSANTAMTLEWSGAPNSTNFQSVAMTGYSTT